jgi:DNA-binding SARP family transcriptional activator
MDRARVRAPYFDEALDHDTRRGVIMSDNGGCRLQVCGPMTVCVHGVDLTARLPIGQARTLFVFLVLHREQPQTRAQLVDALWPVAAPTHADRDIAALLSRLRGIVGPDVLPVGAETRLRLPEHAVVDLEVAYASTEAAERAIARGSYADAWRSGHEAMVIARRIFLPDVRLPWADAERTRLRDALLRSYDAIGEAALGLGGPELVTADRMGTEIVALEPMRESGYRLTIRARVARGNPAEALQVYERMRRRLADELGVDPGPESRALYAQILQGSTAGP